MTVSDALADEPVRKSKTAPTLTAAVAERLRASILACRLPPGARLRLDALRETFKVGYSPLREALMQLASEGFVTLEGMRGFQVAPVSIEDLTDVMETRIAIEALAIRDAISNGDDQWEASIVAAYYRLSKQEPINTADQVVNETWFKRHAEFHHSLIAAARSELTKKFWTMAYDRAERYRRLAVTYGSKPRPDLAEHEGLMKATVTRDLAATCALSEQHIRKTLDIIVNDIGTRMPIFGNQ